MNKKVFLHLIVFIFVILFLVSCERITYEQRMRTLQYDHISFDGEQYYFLSDYEDIPEAFIPFGDSVKVQIVDKNGLPYDTNRFEEALTYKNDDKLVYLYFQSAYFTKDISKAASWNK